MKKILFLLFVCACFQSKAQPTFSKNGYPEHFITGVFIGGTTSYLVYKKTNNKFTSWIIGVATASAIGYLKEVVDPKWFNRTKSGKDFMYTALGGTLGASFIFTLKKKKHKKTPNIAAAFNTIPVY